MEKTITLTIPAALDGERYAGTVIRADGNGHHVFCMAYDRKLELTHAQATEHAAAQGGELPDRVEGALLHATQGDDEFAPAWHWTRELYAGYDAYAWCQYFADGGQYYGLKDGKLRVVLVRRVAI